MTILYENKNKEDIKNFTEYYKFTTLNFMPQILMSAWRPLTCLNIDNSDTLMECITTED